METRNCIFGISGGVFIHASMFARLCGIVLEKRMLFLFRVPTVMVPQIVEDYRQKVENGLFKGTIDEFVQHNHELQKEVLDNYYININLYAASSLVLPQKDPP